MLHYFVLAGVNAVFGSIVMNAPKAPRDLPENWGRPADYLRTSIFITVPLVGFVISAAPNRWFVTQRLALLVSLVPLAHWIFFEFKRLTLLDEIDAFSFVLLAFSLVLPASLIRAYRRHRSKGHAGYF